MPEAATASLDAAVRKLWPELEWINDAQLRTAVERTWVRALLS